jgi:UDP-glucose 4-epimerase
VSEDLCEAFTRRTGIVTVCLRPVAVFDAHDYRRWEAVLAGEQPTVDRPWHMGAFVDVRDTASATVLALEHPPQGHVRLLLSSDDPAIDGPAREIARTRTPSVPWRGDDDPRAALVRSARAAEVLGWRPQHRWDTRERA